MEEQIKKVLKEKVDPVLAAHYGGAVLMSVGSVHDRRSGQGHRDGERSGC